MCTVQPRILGCYGPVVRLIACRIGLGGLCLGAPGFVGPQGFRASLVARELVYQSG